MKAKLDDGTELDVDYEVEEEGSAGYSGYGNTSCDEAPSGPICRLISAEDVHGNDLLNLMTDSERERIEIECAEQHEPDDYFEHYDEH
jgi:hypothetical protein